MLFSKSYIILYFTFPSLICLGSILHALEAESPVSFFSVNDNISFCRTTYWKMYLSSIVYNASSIINQVFIYTLVCYWLSPLSLFLFHWSICLFLSQYHPVLLMLYNKSCYLLMLPFFPTFFIFRGLGYFCFLFFYIHFRISLSSSP